MPCRLRRFGLFAVAVAIVVSPAKAELKRIGDEVAVSGRIDDMVHAVNSSGYQFRVNLNSLSYKGRVDRTLVEEKERGEVTIWLALRDVVLTIGSTSISGRPGSANCGPLDIQLGHRRDLWVAFDFQTVEADDGPELELRGTRFSLPQDNWSVGSPAWVRTSGFGMSQAKVVSGLRDGLVNNKQQIEQRLIDIAPTMLARVVPVDGDGPVDARSAIPAAKRLLTAAGREPMKAEAIIAATGIEG